MNRRTFLAGAGGIASTAVAGCAGILDESGSGWSGERIDQYLEWLPARSPDADPGLSYWTDLIDVERGKAIVSSGKDLNETGAYLIPEVSGLDRNSVDRILRVAVPGDVQRRSFRVCLGDFDTESIRKSIVESTTEESRQIGAATMAHDPKDDRWVGVGEDWIVVGDQWITESYGRKGAVESALQCVAGELPRLVDQVPEVDGMTDQLSLHHGVELSYYPDPTSGTYPTSTFPSLPLVGETLMERVSGDRYLRRERYVFAGGAQVVERPFERRIEDRAGHPYDEGSHSVEDRSVTIDFRGPVGSQPD